MPPTPVHHAAEVSHASEYRGVTGTVTIREDHLSSRHLPSNQDGCKYSAIRAGYRTIRGETMSQHLQTQCKRAGARHLSRYLTMLAIFFLTVALPGTFAQAQAACSVTYTISDRKSVV